MLPNFFYSKMPRIFCLDVIKLPFLVATKFVVVVTNLVDTKFKALKIFLTIMKGFFFVA